MALHAGEVRYDQHGVTAAAVNLAFRLLDAAALKAALASSPGVLAVIASSWFFEEVVRHSTADAVAYRPVEVAVKETTTTGSIYLPDHMDPAAGRCWSTCPLWPQCRAASRLHDLLREYAQARAAAADAAENQATVGRLLDYYLHTAMTASRYTAWRTSITGPPPPGPAPAWAPDLRTEDEAIAWLGGRTCQPARLCRLRRSPRVSCARRLDSRCDERLPALPGMATRNTRSCRIWGDNRKSVYAGSPDLTWLTVGRS